MAWTRVQKSASQATGGTYTLPGASTAGNLLIMVAGNGSATALVPPANWSTVATILNGTVSETYIFAYFNNPGGLSSFAVTGGSGAISAGVVEYTCPGVSGVLAASDTGTKTGGAVGTITVTTGGTAAGGHLAIAAGMEHLTATSIIAWTDPSGYAQPYTLLLATATNHTYCGDNLAISTGGVQSVILTSNVASGSGTGWTGAVATFSQPGTTSVPIVAPSAACIQDSIW